MHLAVLDHGEHASAGLSCEEGVIF
jgi:hypothetical protein